MHPRPGAPFLPLQEADVRCDKGGRLQAAQGRQAGRAAACMAVCTLGGSWTGALWTHAGLIGGCAAPCMHCTACGVGVVSLPDTDSRPS